MGLLHRGDVVDGRFTVLRKLGEGQFAEVYEVKASDEGSGDADLRFALKLEKSKDKHLLRQEYKILRKLSGCCSQVVSAESTGVHNDRFYIIMQLMGETLYDARKRAPCGYFDLPAVKAVGLSTLAALQQLHEQGFIHRDIKPANLVVHPLHASAAKGTWALIDLGLARRYVDESGGHAAPRGDASFRGSTTYASVHAHRQQDLSRRDDLWSWFYLLVECVDGCLPWRPERDGTEHVPADKAWVQQQKEACMEQPQQLTRHVPLPEPLVSVSEYLKGLEFADPPDYSYLATCLGKLPDADQPVPQIPPALLAIGALGGGLLQQPWDGSPAENGAGGLQQQQQQEGGAAPTPASPSAQHVSPFDGGAATAAATGSKRARPGSGSAADLEQLQLQQQAAAKRARPDSAPPKHGMGQQLRQGHGSSSPVVQASPDDADRQGGAAGHQPQPSRLQDAAAAGGGGGGSGSHGPERRGSSQQQARAAVNGADGAAQQRTQQAAGRGRAADQQQSQRGTSAGPAGSGGGGAAGARRTPGTGPAAAAAAAGGRAAEINELLAAFHTAPPDSRAAAQGVIEGLCGLAPLDAVCAIGVTLDKLVHQSKPSCLPEVAQLLLDLAAFAASGAAAARRAAAQQQQPQQQQRRQSAPPPGGAAAALQPGS